MCSFTSPSVAKKKTYKKDHFLYHTVLVGNSVIQQVIWTADGGIFVITKYQRRKGVPEQWPSCSEYVMKPFSRFCLFSLDLVSSGGGIHNRCGKFQNFWQVKALLWQATEGVSLLSVYVFIVRILFFPSGQRYFSETRDLCFVLLLLGLFSFSFMCF